MAFNSLALVLKAADFAARKHSKQRRKNDSGDPYINHPIEVARLLVEAGVKDSVVLAAALLHDTLEDTNTTEEEICREFGKQICVIVLEVTDDKSLPKEERKRCQIQHAPGISHEARLVKLADKLSNLSGLATNPPKGWSQERIEGYCIWASFVVDGLRGTNQILENQLDDIFKKHLPTQDKERLTIYLQEYLREIQTARD